MNRRYDQFLTVQQAAKALNIRVSQLLGMLRSGELRGTSTATTEESLVSSTDTDLARKRLQNLRNLDGDQQ